MLPGDEEAACLVAEKLRAAVEHTPVDVGPGRLVRVTVSIGVATTDQAGYERLNLLRLADRALYRAKQGGRNAVVLVDLQLDAGPPAGEHVRPERAVDGGSHPRTRTRLTGKSSDVVAEDLDDGSHGTSSDVNEPADECP